MKLPRWLSPVRTVEAETGWPRAVCKAVSRRIARTNEWWDIPWALGLLLGWPLLSISMLFLSEAIGDQLFPRFAADRTLATASGILYLALNLLCLALCMGLAIALMAAALTRKTARFLRRYLPAPWCFKCEYPIPAPINGRPCTNCPECGEPIPPEIAALAAERAKG